MFIYASVADFAPSAFCIQTVTWFTFIALLFASPCLSASENVKYAPEIKIGTVFMNSGGLNNVTEGLNTSYGASIDKIRTPLSFYGAFYVEFFRSRVGVELGYEYANRSSFSSLYGVTENVNYSAIPVSLNYQYSFFNSGRFNLLAGVYVGAINVSLSMSNFPAVVEVQPYKMISTAFMMGTGLDFLVRVSGRIRVSSSLYYRYASAPAFHYSGDTLRHNNGDTVAFSNGDTLTMNLSGIKFLLGIIFEWS